MIGGGYTYDDLRDYLSALGFEMADFRIFVDAKNRVNQALAEDPGLGFGA
jgi:hypothetical protein